MGFSVIVKECRDVMFTDGKSPSWEKAPTLHSEWQGKDGQFGLRWSECKSYLPPRCPGAQKFCFLDEIPFPQW